MRKKSIAAIVAIAVAAAIGFSVIGQEDPLPVITPKYVAPEVTIVEPLVVLASEPIHEYQPPTLADAARNNDYLTFDALYAAAVKRGEDVSRFATLHELWTYSITDPIGAFYGPELHARLTRVYPGFADYIEPYRIVDSKGQVFYPSSETRAFLLARAVEGGRVAPKVLVAEDLPIPPKPAREPASVVKSAPVVKAPPVVEQPPAVVPEAPVVIAAEPAPVPVPQPVVKAPTPVLPAQPVKTTTPGSTRGILLLIVGLIGIGLLAVILRTPKEEPLVIKPNNVEPLRKPQAAAPPPDSHAPDSHGGAAAG